MRGWVLFRYLVLQLSAVLSCCNLNHFCALAWFRLCFDNHSRYRGGAQNNILTNTNANESNHAQNSVEPKTPDSLIIDANKDISESTMIQRQEQSDADDQLMDVNFNKKSRLTAEFLTDFITRSSVTQSDSNKLRELIMERALEFLNEIKECEDEEKIPHPKRLLHSLAPKVPAIRHSPDVLLRIQSARSDIDSGISACVVGVIGRICEEYDKICRRKNINSSVADDITKDRRFEQLIECISCGIDLSERKKEAIYLMEKHAISEDIEESIEHSLYDDGLGIRDSCRAAWGIAIVGAHKSSNLENLLLALSLRVRKLLLARLGLLRSSDLEASLENLFTETTFSIDDRLGIFSEELAEDAVTALWTFAHVHRCTGMTFMPLFEACCLILCTDPYDLRRQAQEAEVAIETSAVGSNDIVERLALTETELKNDEKVRKDTLLDWLSLEEMIDIVFSAAFHRHVNMSPSEVCDTLTAVVFDRLFHFLQLESNGLENFESIDSSGGRLLSRKAHLKVEPASFKLEEINSEDTYATDQVMLYNDDMEVFPLVSGQSPDKLQLSTNIRSQHPRCKNQLHFFTLSNLCTVAWAVTELGDSLGEQILQVVMRILVYHGPECIETLSGRDLSSFSWAMARLCMNTTTSCVGDYAVLIVGWIVDDILRREKQQPEGTHLLNRFQPAEFTRCLWAVAVIYSLRVDGTRLAAADAENLGSAALRTASERLELFGLENLAQIVWSFVTLTPTDRTISASETLTLGRILATLETNIIQWESGNRFASNQNQYPPLAREHKRLSLLQGQPRGQVALFDQWFDHEDTEEHIVGSFAEKTRLPLLSNLPIDPLTLCKAACCFERLSSSHDGLHARETLTRVALRLLTSRNGHLMRAFPLKDLIRLGEAAARTTLMSAREMISHFTRRFVCYLNDLSSDHLESLGPGDVVILVWSLGTLGVRYLPGKDDVLSAHRRLHLVSRLPFPNEDQLITLSNSRLVMLLQGLESMSVAAMDGQYMFQFLSFIQNRISFITQESDIVDLLQSIANIRVSVETYGDVNRPVNEKLRSNEVEKSLVDKSPEFMSLPETDAVNSYAEVFQCCDMLISTISEQLITAVDAFQTESLRRILMTLILLPHQSDPLVDAIETIILSRRTLFARSNKTDIGQLFENASLGAAAAEHLLQRNLDASSSSPIDSLKNNLKSLFRSHDNDNTDLAGELEATELLKKEIGEHLKAVLLCLKDAVSEMEKAKVVSTVPLHSLIDNAQCDSVFEVGRCLELIKQYRSINFGIPHQEYLQDSAEQRRDEAKRVLSQSLPQ